MVKRDIRPIKNKLRKESKNIRRCFSPQEKTKKDDLILQRLTATPQYKKCNILLTFVSTPIEVDTIKIINKAFLDKKQVLVPRCIPGRIEMEFCKINSINDLEKGTFSVLEPKNYCKRVNSFPNSICIVPGLVFDMNGYRLGYGKGYYDRFLKDYCGFRIGVCYSNCIKNRLPRGRYDEKINLLITDKFNKSFYNNSVKSHKKEGTYYERGKDEFGYRRKQNKRSEG